MTAAAARTNTLPARTARTRSHELATAAAAPSNCTRLFSTTRSRQLQKYPPSKGGGGGYKGKGMSNKVKGIPLPSKFARLPSDGAIPFKWVQVVDGAKYGLPVPEDSNNNLSEPVQKRTLLLDLDRVQYALVMVSMAPATTELLATLAAEVEDTGEEGEPDAARRLELLRGRPAVLEEPEHAPICRILDKKAFAAAADAKAKAERRVKVARKELELNWAIAAHDLSHKLRQMTGFLLQGRVVQVQFARKKGGRTATLDEANALLRQVRAAATATGARESKLEGRFPQTTRMLFEGGSEAAAAKEQARLAAAAAVAAEDAT